VHFLFQTNSVAIPFAGGSVGFSIITGDGAFSHLHVGIAVLPEVVVEGDVVRGFLVGGL
jgi:hypothetical protein